MSTPHNTNACGILTRILRFFPRKSLQLLTDRTPFRSQVGWYRTQVCLNQPIPVLDKIGKSIRNFQFFEENTSIPKIFKSVITVFKIKLPYKSLHKKFQKHQRIYQKQQNLQQISNTQKIHILGCNRSGSDKSKIIR